MRIHRTTALTVACITGVLGLAAPAHAETAATLYVDNSTGVPCSDSGEGTQAQPFCSITAAAAAAVAGQTVEIAPGLGYTGQVALTHSGEPGKPIVLHGSSTGSAVRIDAGASPAFVVDGLHDVELRGLQAYGGVSVTNSDRITLDRLTAVAQGTTSGVRIAGGGHDITLSRSDVRAARGTVAVVIEGATGTLVSRVSTNGLGHSTMITVTDAPNTSVLNNTGIEGCGSGVVLGGGSTGATVVNNIFTSTPSAVCTAADKGPLVSVAATAAEGTRVGYNNLRSRSGAALYSWAGTEYNDPNAFHAATGQGEKDLVIPGSQFPTGDLSLAIDSADATVPRVQETGASGLAPADDPRIPNTGTGYGYLDRGAREEQDSLTGVALTVDQTWAPYGTTVTATAKATHTWPAALTYTFDFGDGSQVTTKDTTATHVYSSPCSCKSKVTAVTATEVSKTSNQVDVKVTTPGPIVPPLSATPELPLGNNPIGRTPPLSVAVDAAVTDSAWPIASYAYDYGDGFLTESNSWHNGQHTYAKPGDYRITVTVRDIKGNVGTASTTFHAEYAKATYTPVTPFRMLDTRQTSQTLWGGNSLTLDVSNGYPDANKPVTSGSPEAVVLNVTATNATTDTYLTLFPGGQDRPASSNLNVKAGQTVANLVTVPVGSDGKVQLFNFAGRSDVIVDFVGYYQPNAGQGFTSTGPARLSDAPMAAGATSTLKVAGTAGVPADATAVVVNLTADGPTANGYLTAYPHGTDRPTVSNLNFRPGQTIANQAIVPVGADGTIDLYNFTGTTRVIVDVFGYYSPGSKGLFTPTVPVRLADTRSDNTKQPLGTGAQLNLPVAGTHGVPANATAAVLNVTATQPSNPGYLTVWPDLTARPGTSNLNLAPGTTTPNHVTTPLGTNGRANIYNFAGTTHVIADLAGWFTEN
ncbi:parallel beta helix pectate lyase-like protein [Streptomyces sp. TLI_235]|nr:PKD domain-containing protein [Streptomyces sp. TLI_235]PBC78546.1 parallel beta helix pectate lyase-like protein [Streptomyces sp. TLI_235]